MSVSAAVVGAGRMGRWHARAIEAVGGSLLGVVDPQLELARALAPPGGAFTTLDALLAGGPPDVVHVCTPVDTHADIVTAALGAGAHVVVEKPVTRDAGGTRSLVAAAEAAGRMLVPVHQFLFQPGVMALLERREELGDLVHCSFVAASAGAEHGAVGRQELVAEILPHPLALFARLCRARIDELEWSVVVPAEGELRALTVAGAASFEIAITANGRPTRNELDVLGTEATGHADLFHGYAFIERGRPTRVDKLMRPFVRSSAVVGRATANLAVRAARRETAYPGLRELIGRTYDAVTTAGAAPIPPILTEETIAVASARDAILGRARPASAPTEL